MKTKIQHYAKLATPAFVLVYCVMYYLLGEKIPINGGLGGDGFSYGRLASNFYVIMKIFGVDVYSATRIFPSFLIYNMSVILKYPLSTNQQIIQAFSIYNTILLSAMAWLWLQICKISKFNDKLFWIGFISLFINFAVLKTYQYYEVYTDISGLFFGALFLYAYLNEKKWLIILVVVFAAFTWPVAIYFSWFFMFNRKSLVYPIQQLRIDKYIPFIVTLVYFLLGILVAAQDSELHLIIKPYFVLGMIIACCTIYILAKQSNFFSVTYFSFKAREELNNRYLYLFFIPAIVYFSLLHWIQKYHGVHTVLSFKYALVHGVLSSAVIKPALFIIAPVVFFGPTFIFLIFLYKKIYTHALEEGYGIYLFLLATLILTLDSESRHLIFSYPLLIYLLCKVLSDLQLPEKFILHYTIISLYLSKIYIVIHAEDNKNFHHFPWQKFFMNIGGYMSWGGYTINLIMVIPVIIYVFYLLKISHYKTESELKCLN